MKNLIAVIVAATFAAPAFAADAVKPEAAKPAEAKPAPAKSSWSTWLETIKSGLTNSAVSGQRKRGKGGVAVAAVRGDDQTKKVMSDPDEPSLKGSSKEKKDRKDMEQKAQFKAAIELLIDKKYEDGIAALEKLQKDAPKFQEEDVAQALAGAKNELAAKNNQPVPEPAKKP